MTEKDFSGNAVEGESGGGGGLFIVDLRQSSFFLFQKEFQAHGSLQGEARSPSPICTPYPIGSILITETSIIRTAFTMC